MIHGIDNLTALIARSGPLLPPQIDVVVGVGGGGLLAATLISLHLNSALCSLDDLLAGRTIETGRTRRHARMKSNTTTGGSFLVVTNMLGDGSALLQAQQAITNAQLAGNFVYCAVYATRHAAPADIVLAKTSTEVTHNGAGTGRHANATS